MKPSKLEGLHPDVLVIGGGMAGLMAALSARECNADVLLVCKGKAGRSGNSLVSGGGIAAATDEDGNTPARFLEDLIRSGKGLADLKLARVLAHDSGDMIERLSNLGVPFRKEGGRLLRRMVPGHSVPRNIPTRWDGLSYMNRGLSFTTPLLEACCKAGVMILEGMSLRNLVKSEGQVVGARFFTSEKDTLTIPAGAVILATGGFGFLFAKSNNTNDARGNGLSAALLAGCELRDMEQVQFYPTMMFSPVRMTVSNPLFGIGAVLRNSEGEVFMHRYDPEGNMAARDSMARAIFMEIQEGRDVRGSVVFDCSGVDPSLFCARFGEFRSVLQKYGVDPLREPLQVSPCVHFTLGGLAVDEDGRSSVGGLFAAGEICGGIHGANRLSGAALMEACVFGRRAGIAAASQSIRTACTESRTGESEGAFLDPSILMEIRTTLWDQCSLVRHEEGLKSAAGVLEELERILCTTDADDDPSVPAELLTGMACIESARIRRESRGAHYRSDFPKMDTAFEGPVHCKYRDGRLSAAISTPEA